MPRAGLLSLLVLAAACRSDARKPPEPLDRVVRLVATAEARGTPEPCGCTSDPLGDVARVASLVQGGLWLDAGGLLYDEEAPSATARPQADLKARTLARVCGDAEVGLGPDDLRRGPERVAPARQAANVTGGITPAPPRLRVVGGIKVGVFGVVAPRAVAALGVPAGDPVAAARSSVAQLRKDGAQLVVALCGMTRAEARRLMEAVPGIAFGIIGEEVGEGMPEAEPVNGGFLVAPADQVRRVAEIELHVRNGQVALTPFAGEAARKVSLERTQRKVGTLTLELAGWKNDPTADHAFVAARQAELQALKAQKTKLEQERPVPPESSYFTYALEPVRVSLPRDPKVADELRQMYREIGGTNLAAARATPPPAAEPGKPSYVGMAACQKCHKPAVEFWRHTVHAGAWKTLVDVDKQYNYDCTGCHVTGLSQPGGANLATVEKSGLVDVQCEVCHGPGGKHVAEAGLEEPKSLTVRPADRFCADNCHTREHSDTFQLVPYLREIVGRGHGEKRRKELGDGVTGHELRQKALSAAGR